MADEAFRWMSGAPGTGRPEMSMRKKTSPNWARPVQGRLTGDLLQDCRQQQLIPVRRVRPILSGAILEDLAYVSAGPCGEAKINQGAIGSR